MVNPVIIADIESRWRPLSVAEMDVATALLEDAWAVVHAHVPDVDSRLSSIPPTLDEAVVRVVVCRMVLRVLRNPDSKAVEGVDDYKFTRHESAASGHLYLTDDDLALLSPASATSAWSIRPHYVPDDPASMAAWREGLA